MDKIIWYCLVCGKAEVHDSEETTEEWENAYSPSVTSEQQEYFQSIVGEDCENWDVWGAVCPTCKVKKD
jgi:hypothetical protein